MKEVDGGRWEPVLSLLEKEVMDKPRQEARMIRVIMNQIRRHQQERRFSSMQIQMVTYKNTDQRVTRIRTHT